MGAFITRDSCKCTVEQLSGQGLRVSACVYQLCCHGRTSRTLALFSGARSTACTIHVWCCMLHVRCCIIHVDFVVQAKHPGGASRPGVADSTPPTGSCGQRTICLRFAACARGVILKEHWMSHITKHCGLSNALEPGGGC